MDVAAFTDLSERVAELLATLDGDDVTAITFGPSADGSSRVHAIVNTYDLTNQLEQQFRVTSPAPTTAPPWAKAIYAVWLIEVHVGTEWRRL